MGDHRSLIVIGLLAAALSAPALAAPRVVTLGADATGDKDPITSCGSLAASPYETTWEGHGLKDTEIFLDGAMSTCEAALAAAPDSIEIKAWLGRVYRLVGRYKDAARLLQEAADSSSLLGIYELSVLKSTPMIDGGDDAQAVALLQQAAQEEFVPALDDLAKRYESGTGVDRNSDEALRLYRKAADKGDGLALYKVGTAYQNGAGVKQDFGKARSFFQKAVDAGEPKGYAGLGGLYQNGQGVETDNTKAAELYQKGADQTEPQSETALAFLYEQGLGVEQSYEKSFALLSDAANQNDGFGQAALALHYLFGQGVEVDMVKAQNLAFAAQQKQVAYANGILGYIYAEGLGTERDLSSALNYFQLGSDAGDEYSAKRLEVTKLEVACQDAAGSPYEPGGVGHGVEFSAIDPDSAASTCQAALDANPESIGDKVWLGRVFLKAKRFGDALPLLKLGADKGNVLAQATYADLLLNGVGVDADPAAAIKLYEVAAEKSYAPAQYALGTVYAEGAGVEADPVQAAVWLKRALNNGLEKAREQLASLEGQDESAVSFDMTGFGREGPAY